MYKSVLKPLLFLLSPEKAHNFSTKSFGVLNAVPILGSLVRKMLAYENKSLRKTVFGIDFPNPVGLAAGFDIIIGGNIGKNKLTPNENAVDDYLICFKKLFDHVDYFVVNVSSPNTPGLRSLQEKGPLSHILNTLQAENRVKGRAKPILLKIAPDLTEGQLDDIIEIVQDTKLAGIIATNTTIERNLPNSDKAMVKNIGNGGLSGRPVADRSTEVIAYIAKKSEGKIPIIGVGGINSAKEAQRKLDAGASLVQIYSALVYEGPFLVKRIKKGLTNI